MLLIYELRVLLAGLVARWRRRRAEAAEAEAAVAARRTVVTEAKPVEKTPHGTLLHQVGVLRAVEAQQAAESEAMELLDVAEKAEARHERLRDRGGRLVPGMLAAAQAWVGAAVLTHYLPGWATAASQWAARLVGVATVMLILLGATATPASAQCASGVFAVSSTYRFVSPARAGGPTDPAYRLTNPAARLTPLFPRVRAIVAERPRLFPLFRGRCR